VIDLHCHVLPEVDDGPVTLEETLDMARAAAGEGTRVLVATPHVSYRYPTSAERMRQGVEQVAAALREARIPVDVATGAEIALEMLSRLDRAELERLTLGGGPYLLLEAPLSAVGGELEAGIRALQDESFGVVLAHPERCPSFHRDPGRLSRLVDAGVLCSLTASSFTGRFGRPVRALSERLLAGGLVHDVASDAHDAERRPPALRSSLRAAEGRLPALAGLAPWLTKSVPEAILSGRALPAPPAAAPSRRRRRLRWLP
jgi:protein-tyrosine phosphatase